LELGGRALFPFVQSCLLLYFPNSRDDERNSEHLRFVCASESETEEKSKGSLCLLSHNVVLNDANGWRTHNDPSEANKSLPETAWLPFQVQ
jgi:hypothetical protein